MRVDNKGFFSIDALFVFTLVLIISLSFTNVYDARKAAAEQMGARMEAKMVGEKLAAAINAVYVGGENLEIFLDLPENVVYNNYYLSFDNATWTITVENTAWSTVSIGSSTNRVENFVMSAENLDNAIWIHWENDQIKVVST